MNSIHASHVVVAQMGTVDGQPMHMNSVDGKGVTVSVDGSRLTVNGGGLNLSYDLSSATRVEVVPDGSRFGLMVPGEVTGFLVPEPGMHIVRIDARTFGSPKKKELRAFGDAVIEAVNDAGGSV